MRKIEITQHEFDNFLFPAWANAQNPGDPEVVVRITRKMKEISLEKPLNDRQQELRDQGKVVFADRTLIDNEEILLLEEDEWKIVRDMFSKSLKVFTTLAMEDAYELSEKIKAAQKTSVGKVEV